MASQTHTSSPVTTSTVPGAVFDIGRLEGINAHLQALDELALETLEAISLADTVEAAHRLADRGHALRAMAAEFHGQIDGLVQSACRARG